MKTRWIVLLVGATIAVLATSSGAVSGQTPEPTPRTTIVRVYYPDLATRNKIIISFEAQLMETNYEEGYHILEVTAGDIERLLAAGLRVEKDDTWTGPGSFCEIPPEETEPTPGHSCPAHDHSGSCCGTAQPGHPAGCGRQGKQGHCDRH